MIRYDPTENGHCDYEVKSVQSKIKEKNIKKKRHDKSILEMEPVPPEPKVSKNIYYAVSDTLTESLKQKGEFSLLKAYRKEENDTGTFSKNSIHILVYILFHYFTPFHNFLFQYIHFQEMLKIIVYLLRKIIKLKNLSLILVRLMHLNMIHLMMLMMMYMKH